MTRNFVVTVREREADQPCSLVFEPFGNVGLRGTQEIILDLQPGTDIEDARQIAQMINNKVRELRIT